MVKDPRGVPAASPCRSHRWDLAREDLASAEAGQCPFGDLRKTSVPRELSVLQPVDGSDVAGIPIVQLLRDDVLVGAVWACSLVAPMDHGGARFTIQVPAGALDGAVAVLWRADPLAGACAWVWDEITNLAPREFPVPTEVAVPVELQLGL
eukprot:9155984-Heterocapsa_arctica.AAC.1